MSPPAGGLRQIARETGRDNSTVPNVLSCDSCRRGGPRFYRASSAQCRSEARRLRCRRRMGNPELRGSA